MAGSGRSAASTARERPSLVRWLAERARRRGFATSEVQISEGETPLDHLETVYRRVSEHLATPELAGGALGAVLDGWPFALDEDVLAAGEVLDVRGDGVGTDPHVLRGVRVVSGQRQNLLSTPLLQDELRRVTEQARAQVWTLADDPRRRTRRPG